MSVLLVVAGNSSQNENTFDFLWAVSTKKNYSVTLLWSASQCVYLVRPITLLLCIFPFCIFLLYRTDPQVEVQVRILLKDKYVKSCQNTNTGNHIMIFCTQFVRKCVIGFFTLQKQLANQGMFLIYDPNFPLLRISSLHCMDLQPYSHDCFSKISRTFGASGN